MAALTPSYTTNTISLKIQHCLNTLTQHIYYAFYNLFSAYNGQFFYEIRYTHTHIQTELIFARRKVSELNDGPFIDCFLLRNRNNSTSTVVNLETVTIHRLLFT